LVLVKTWGACGSTNHAELEEKYFCKIKFSTQVLISVWKIGARKWLTALSSTACSGLHNFGAAIFSPTRHFCATLSECKAQSA
jgi:hypothetical protein